MPALGMENTPFLPVAHPDDGFGQDEPQAANTYLEPAAARAASAKCAFKSNTGRACSKFAAAGQDKCVKHTCSIPGCFNGKSSKKTHCPMHDDAQC